MTDQKIMDLIKITSFQKYSQCLKSFDCRLRVLWGNDGSILLHVTVQTFLFLLLRLGMRPV